jgi:hypothetical protein
MAPAEAHLDDVGARRTSKDNLGALLERDTSRRRDSAAVDRGAGLGGQVDEQKPARSVTHECGVPPRDRGVLELDVASRVLAGQEEGPRGAKLERLD